MKPSKLHRSCCRACLWAALSLLLLWCSIAPAGQPSFYARRDYPGTLGEPGFVGDFNRDGIPDVVIRSGVPGSQLRFCAYFGNGDGSFRAGPCSSGYANNPIVRTLAVDINADGKLDLIFLVQNFSTIYVLLGDGDGTFAAPVQVLGLADVQDFTVADFNGDGKQDIAAATFHNTVEVAPGLGGGRFGSPVVTSLTSPVSLAATDLNRDGKLDLLVTTTSLTQVLLGRGDGTFSLAASIPLGCGLAFSAAADFNGDGLADLAVGCYGSTGKEIPYVAIFLNQGNGTVRLASFSQINGVVLGLAVGDVNGDGRQDVVAVGGVGTAFVLLGRGDGTLRSPYTYQLSGGEGWVALVDLRRSGVPDMVTAYSVANTWSVLLNVGHGLFMDGVPVLLKQYANSAASADLNGDGHPDLAVATPSGIQILYGTGRAANPFQPGPLLPTNYLAYYEAIADFNHDGILDIAAATYNPAGNLDYIEVFLGQSGGEYTHAATYPAGPAGRFVGEMVAADLNHDGTPDIVTASGVLLAKGDGTFRPFSVFPTAALRPDAGVDFTPAVADFNGDGNLDVATFTDYPGSFDATLVVFLGKGDGTFRPPITVGNYRGIFAFAGDFNGDRIPDLVVGSRNNDGFNLLLGNGDGTFRLGSQVYFFNNFLPIAIVAGAVGDFNGDGKLDVAIVDMDGFELLMVAGNGDGTFSGAPFPSPGVPCPWEFGAGAYPTQILVGQFHAGAQPGRPDLLTVSGDGTLTLLVNITR